MRVLFAVPQMPDPYGGGSHRMYWQIVYLARLGVEIDLVCPTWNGEIPPAIKKCVHKIYSPERNGCSMLDNIIAVLSPAAYRKENGLSREVARALNENSYDIVHVHKPQMSVYFNGLKKLPVVIDLWAYGLEGALREFAVERSLCGKVVKLRRLLRYYVSDKLMYHKFLNYFVVSPEARKEFLSCYPSKRVYVSPHGVEMPPASYLADSYSAGNMLVFTGDMSFSQNVDTVLYFVREIYPALKKYVPDVTFCIVGKNPLPEILALTKDKSIKITGFVPNVGEFLGKAAAFVAPIRTGSGLRTKILEAFAYSLPVVTTRQACEGINVKDGINVILAETPEEFTIKTTALLSSAAARHMIGAASRSLVERDFNWERISVQIKGYYDEILNSNNIKR